MSCSTPDEYVVELPTSIISFDRFEQSKTRVYYAGDTFILNLSIGQPKWQRISGWMHTKELLLMSESSQSSQGQYYYQALYLIDFQKRIVDTLYSANAEAYEIMTGEYITPNDSLLLVHILPKKSKKDTLEYLYTPLDIIVIDLNERIEIERIENFCPYSFYYYQSRSFFTSPNGKQFVYAISDERYINQERARGNEIASFESNGVYIYDFAKRTHLKISNHGVNPIWSPDCTTIAYYSAEKIWFYDIKDKKEVVFYEPDDGHTIVDIQWTPDGDNIYCRSRRKRSWFSLGYTFDDVLINIKNMKKFRSDELSNLGYYFYWK